MRIKAKAIKSKANIEPKQNPYKKQNKSPYPNEKYYYISAMGIVASTTYVNSLFDDWQFSSGNYYKTQADAEFAKEKIILLAEMQRFADENNEHIDWEDGKQEKFYLYFDCCSLKVIIDWVCVCKQSNVYFTENCKDKALELFGDRLKKYIARVDV